MSFFSDLEGKKSFFDDLEQQPTSPSFFSDIEAQESIPMPKEKTFLQKLGSLSISPNETPLEPPITEIDPNAAIGAFKQAAGGTLEGATLGAVNIFEPENENEQMVRRYFEIMGIQAPLGLAQKGLGKVYNLIKKGSLRSLARLGGAGVLGASTKTAQELFKEGEFPDPEEIAKEGAIWMAIDGALQLAGVGKQFSQAVSSIAKKENVPISKVINKIWESAKNKIKTKFGREVTPETLNPEDADIILEEAGAITPKAKSPTKEIEIKPTLEKQIADKKAELEKYYSEKGKTATQESSQLIQEINRLELEKYDKEKRTFKIPKNELIKSENGNIHYEPAGVVGDYIRDTQVREALKEVLDYPVRYHHPQLGPEAYYQSGYPISISMNEHNSLDFKRILFEEAIHALQDKRGRQENALKEQKNIPYESQNAEISAKKFSEWANNLEEKVFNKKLDKEKTSTSSDTLKNAPLQAKGRKMQPPQLANKRPVIGKKQAAKRSEILKIFRKAFSDPIRLGKFKQRALGIHKMWPKVTRLLKDNDIETAAHEIGHNLHTTLYGGDAKTHQEQRHNVERALMPYIGELKNLAAYEPYTLEGFAEFTRIYVTNPDAALALAPKFYQKFEADLEAQYPELKNALLQAREYYAEYLEGTPESRIASQVEFSREKGKIENILDSIRDWNLDKIKTEFLDDVFASKRLVAEAFGIPITEVESLKDPRNLYRSLRVLKGAVGKADVFLGFETFDANTLKKTGQGLRQILQQIPEKNYEEFTVYLLARRGIEKLGQNVEVGFSLGDAVYTERKLSPKYEKVAKKLDAYGDSLLKYAMDSDVISKDQYTQIRKNNLMYVPFQRVMEDEKGTRKSGSGKLQASNKIQRMKGSTRDIIDPLESFVKNTYSIIINAEKNRSALVLAELSKMKDVGKYVERLPTPTGVKEKLTKGEIEKAIVKHLKDTKQFHLLEMDNQGDWVMRSDISDILPDLVRKFGATSYPKGENIITAFRQGNPEYYEVSKELYEMWSKGVEPYTANLVTKILRIPARTLRAGAILNPAFMQKNIIRDTWGSFLFTKYGKDIKDPVNFFIDMLYSPLSMLSQAARKGPLYVEWLKSGGGLSTMQSMDRNSVAMKLREVRDGLKPTEILKWMRKIAEISEESNRLAEFARAIQVESDTRLGKEIAAFAARDLSIDFAKMGLQTKSLNQIIPFFNATIQGGDKLVRTVVGPEGKAEFLARGVGFIAIPALIFAWLNSDDERTKEFQEQEKDFNFITFIGDTAIKIPVPFETGVLLNGLTQRMFNYMMTKDPDAFKGFMGSVLDASIPSAVPSFALPVFETIANKNFFTGGRIIPADKEKLISKYQYRNYHSVTARLIGRAMAYMLGDETTSKAASPAVIDHFIHSWTGGLGKLTVSLLDTLLEAEGMGDKIPKPEQSVVDRLGLNAFHARFPRANTRSIEEFYDNYQDAVARRKSIDYARKMDLEDDESLEKAHKRYDNLYDWDTLNAAYKAIQNSQKAINGIYNAPDIDSKTKKEMIDDLYLQQISFAKAANSQMKEHRKVKKKTS